MGFCGKCCAKSPHKALTSIKHDRGCTDILFLVAFFVSFGLVVMLMQLAIAAGGDPEKTLRGLDLEGNICGISEATQNLSFAAWPNPTEYKTMVCVDSCDRTNMCDSTQFVYKYPSIPFMGAYCIPDANSSLSVAVEVGGSAAELFDKAGNLYSRSLADTYTAFDYIVASPAVCVVVAFLFCIFLRKFAGVLTATALFIVGACGMACGGLFYNFSATGLASGDLTIQQSEYVLYFSYAIFIIVGLYLIVLLALRKQILIAIEVVKESAGAINDMKMLVFFPIWPSLAVLGYLALWVYIGLFFASVFTVDSGGTLPDAVKHYHSTKVRGRACVLMRT